MFKQYQWPKRAALAVLFVCAALFALVYSAGAATSPALGTAGSFAVLAETNITDVPTSAIAGGVGLSPATGAGIGVACSEVTGTIYSVDAAGPLCKVTNPGLLTTAINDMMTVFTGGSGTGIDQTCTTDYGAVAKDLTTVSPLGPGVYCADAFLLTGNLTLSGSGVWIFKSRATLTTSAGSSVTGGDTCNVWWRLVSEGTLVTNTAFVGNILAGTSIHLQTGASLNGRALAQAAVTLDHNTITRGPICSAGATATPTATNTSTDTPTTAPTGTPSNTPTSMPSPIATATPTGTPTPAPTGVPTAPATNTPVATPTSTPTNTPTTTPTNTPVGTPTNTPTNTRTATSTTTSTPAGPTPTASTPGATPPASLPGTGSQMASGGGARVLLIELSAVLALVGVLALASRRLYRQAAGGTRR